MLKWLIALAVILSLLGATYAAYTSNEFNNCTQHQGQYPTAENKENKASPILVPTPSDVRVLWACIGGYSNANGIALTAIATILLTIITGLLAYLALDQGATSKRQTRAYVAIDSPYFGEKYPTKITMRVRNEGQTPAYKAYSHLNTQKVEFEGELPADFKFPDNNTDPGRLKPLITIGPRSDYTLSFIIDPADIIAVLDRQSGLFIYGHVDYLDAFGTKRTTEFCYRYLGERVAGDGDHVGHRLIIDEQHNHAT